jgi:hypothetical protein
MSAPTALVFFDVSADGARVAGIVLNEAPRQAGGHIPPALPDGV